MDEDRLPRSEISVVILCGGQGTRIREASESLPKPLVDIGGRPILWQDATRIPSDTHNGPRVTSDRMAVLTWRPGYHPS